MGDYVSLKKRTTPTGNITSPRTASADITDLLEKLGKAAQLAGSGFVDRTRTQGVDLNPFDGFDIEGFDFRGLGEAAERLGRILGESIEGFAIYIKVIAVILIIIIIANECAPKDKKIIFDPYPLIDAIVKGVKI